MTNRTWQIGTLRESHMVAENVMSLTFDIPEFGAYEAGQHCDIRLTAPNGYQAERSYSIASSPESSQHIEFGVQLLTNGEVSPYLWNLKPGAQIEIRGPIGGHFIWNVSMPGPLLLIGGGSGMVPLMSMLRHHQKHLATDAGREIVFIISARMLEYVLYYDELQAIAAEDPQVKVILTITDTPPPGWTGYARRVDESMLRETIGAYVETQALTYICGPTAFVEAVASTMVTLGFNSPAIKTERFG
jgi:ferredoxin-NADP reductase